MGINPFDHGSQVHTDMWKTQGLKQALDKYGFDAAFGGARRDEEKSRAKERIFSLPLAHSIAGTRRTSGPSSGGSTTRARTRARASACSRSPTGPSSTSGSTSISRTSRSCRCTSPATRPVVDRDGTLVMVDDERMPLRAGEKPMLKSVRFRTLGCYPLTGAVESEADTLPDDHPGDAADHDLRASGAHDRPRLRRVDGEEEARGVFLMAHASDSYIAHATSSNICAAHEKKSLLRFITCGSVDDGKSTLIGRLLYESKMLFEDQLAALEADSKKVGTRGGELDLRACCSTALPPSASRASRSTSRTASSRPTGASSSSPTRPATSSTRATW